MNTPVEREGSGGLKDRKELICRMFDQRGAIAALQLVAAFRRRDLPTLPKLGTRDPDNPSKRIEGANALIIGKRIVESHGRKPTVTLIALFPEIAKGMPVAETSFVEFRSYTQLTFEQIPGRAFLIPVPDGAIPSKTHQLMFTDAGKARQWELIELTLEAIYRPPTEEPPVLKS